MAWAVFYTYNSIGRSLAETGAVEPERGMRRAGRATDR